MRLRGALLAAATVAFLVALLVAPHEKTQGPPLRDFEAYYAAGETWQVGGDPYSRDIWRGERNVPGVVAARDELLPFVGPPFGLPLWSVLARLPFGVASIAWGAVLGLAFTTVTIGSLILARGRLRWPAVAATLLLAAAFAPLTSAVALGQVALVSCAAIVALPFALRPRGTFGAIVAAFVAGLQPNLAIVLAVRVGDARARIAYVCAALVAILGSTLAASTGGLARYAAIIRDHGAAERFIAIQTTPGAVAYALGASPAVASAFALALAVVVVAVVGWQSRSPRYAPVERLFLACAAVSLVLPFAHEHDFAIAFAPALVLVTRARGTAWSCAACATLALGIDWLGLAQRPNDLVATLSLAFAGACALVALAPERLSPRHALPFALVAVVAVVAPLAATHRLPVWPDALPANFHVAAKLPAAVVWQAEQAASGIATREPMWGWLRTIPLVAAAALWATASYAFAAAAEPATQRASARAVEVGAR
ncbi:MAG: hypothetical protein NVSMB59_11180 [Vulcanimicrobiaceae bacterium]